MEQDILLYVGKYSSWLFSRTYQVAELRTADNKITK